MLILRLSLLSHTLRAVADFFAAVRFTYLGGIIILLDIHSHILPAVDDGADDMDEALKILEMMKNDGVTHVIATPHFYPGNDSLNDFKSRTKESYKSLCTAAAEKNLPHIFLGSEVLYYRYIGTSESINEFCLNGSRYLLLELTDECITDSFFEDITDLKNKSGIIPIIAHIERYYRAPSYKKLLKFVKKEDIPTQINASSFFSTHYCKIAEKLIKKGYVNFLATDAHSTDKRPPKMKDALQYISNKLGSEYASGFIRNSQILYDKITQKEDSYEKQYAEYI